MDDKTLSEMMNGLKKKYGFKSVLVMFEDDKSIGMSSGGGSPRFARELPEMALQAVNMVQKKDREVDEMMRNELLGMLTGKLPEGMRAEVLGGMPDELKEVLADLKADTEDKKADRSESAKSTVVDIMERIKKGSDEGGK